MMNFTDFTYKPLHGIALVGCAAAAIIFAGCGGGGSDTPAVTSTTGSTTGTTTSSSTTGPPAPPIQLTGTTGTVTGTTTGGPPPPPLGGGPSAPTNGLVAYYNADNNAMDSVGGFNGTLKGTAGYAPGIFNQAFSFDGTPGGGIAVADAPGLAITGAISVSAWIRPNTFPTAAKFLEAVVFRGDDRNGLDPYLIGVNYRGEVEFRIESNTAVADLRSRIIAGQWYLATGTLDDSGDMRLYLNGILVAETITDVRPLQDLVSGMNAGVGIGDNNAPGTSSFDYSFNGQIDDVRLYNRALTAGEVLTMFNAGSGAATGSTSTTSSSTSTSGTSTSGTTGPPAGP